MNSILTDCECRYLIMNFTMSGPKSEDEIFKAIRWAEQARVDSVLLACVLRCELIVSIDDSGELTYRSADQDEIDALRMIQIKLELSEDAEVSDE